MNVDTYSSPLNWYVFHGCCVLPQFLLFQSPAEAHALLMVDGPRLEIPHSANLRMKGGELSEKDHYPQDRVRCTDE